MTSSNGNIFRVTGPFYVEFTGHLQRPVTRSFDFSFIYAWTNAWNTKDVADLRRHRTIMTSL